MCARGSGNYTSTRPVAKTKQTLLDRFGKSQKQTASKDPH